MAITAQDIHNQSFSIDRKGYDVDEVDVFLEFVATEIDNLNRQIAQLESSEAALAAEATTALVAEGEIEQALDTRVLEATPVAAAPSEDVIALEAELADAEARIADLEAQLAEKAANDSAISQALIIAQRSADEILAKANNESSDIILDAQDEAAKIVKRANDERERVADAIRKLEESREHARENYADLLKNFVTDASRKLADLGYINGDAPEFTYNASTARGAAAVDLNASDSEAGIDLFSAYGSQTTGQLIEAAPAVAAAYEKDLSGFGDAADDFDDID
jgi:DivIVA domain-containing protein